MTGLLGRLADLFLDLKRRRVFRVSAAYVVIGWVVIEVASTTFPLAGLPDWTPRLVLALTLLGFPIAVLLAWAYDITPEGVRRTDSSSSPERWSRAQAVLSAALELPAAERAAYIRQMAGRDEAFREDVLSLLGAHGRSGPLERPVSEWVVDQRLVGPLGTRPMEGRVVGQYEIVEKLGGGGMGVVYRAKDRRLEREVALKFLPPHLSHDPEAKRRFILEAQAAAALDHPNICTLLEIGETEDGQLFLAMPYYVGETLNRRFARGPLPANGALDLVTQAARGLAAAHAKGIVHRDIKPANLIVTQEGMLKILDFGIAKLATASASSPTVAGTVAYMSPEQAKGDMVDARTDVWSLGVVLYEALAGRRPFEAATEDRIVEAIRRGDPDPITVHSPAVPARVEAIVRRSLSVDPGDRYPSAAALHEELTAALAEGTAPREPTVGKPAAPAATTDTEAMLEGERRQATVVASTIGGYAQLVESSPPHEIRAVEARIRVAADEIATRFGGVVNGLAHDRIELLFGVPDSHEDHCFRAVRAALELHERVRGIAVARDEAPRVVLALHTGVDTGQVVARSGPEPGRFRLVGGPVTIAARLEAQAGPDELWITPTCQRLVGPFFEARPGAPVVLGSGQPEVVPHRIVRLSGLRTRLEAAQRIGLTSYVGRQPELIRLREALQAAEEGSGQLVAIVGEAGVGKSRLMHEFRRELSARDVTVLQGRCQSYGGTVAYLPFIEVLREAVGLEGAEPDERGAAIVQAIQSIGEELEDYLPLYLHLLSASHPRHPLPSHLHGEAFRHAVQEALAGLITLLTRRRPAALLLDDWHWVDEASHGVLGQIAELAPGHPLLVVATARPGVTWWSASQGLTILGLEPLDREGGAEMLRTVLGARELPAELTERVHDRTAGNPFFIEEVARTLVEEGVLRVHGNGVSLAGTLDALQLPDTVEAVIRARLDRLDRGARDVARLAAVIGREFERRLLEEAMEERSRLPHAIQTLKAAGLIQQIRVVPDPAYRFNHALTQDVAYASLLDRQRTELHGRVAEVIERHHAMSLDEHYDRLARHFSCAGRWRKAVHYGMQSADRLARLSAFSDALQKLEHCEHWLDSIDDESYVRVVLVDVLLRQERLSETLGLRARQQALIDRLVTLLEGTEDSRALAELYMRQGDLFTLLGRFDDAERVLHESLRLRRSMREPEAIRNTLRSLGLLRWHQKRQDEAIPLIEETLAIDREQDDTDGLIGDLSNMGVVLKSMGDLARAKSILEEALALIDEHAASSDIIPGAPLKECYILHNLANVYRQLGENDAAVAHLQRAKRLTERQHLPIQLSYHLTSFAHICLQQGRIEECLDLYQQAVEVGRRCRFIPGLSQTLRMLGEVLVGLGRDAEALPYLTEAAALFAQLRDALGEAGVWRDVARAQESLGDAGETRTAWQQAAPLFRQVGDLEGEVEALEGIARATRRCGLTAGELVRTHREAFERAESAGALEAQGRLLNALGIIEWERGCHEEALAHYQAAQTVLERLGDLAGVGLVLNSQAVTLRALGRRDEARRRLEEALPVHRQSGSALLEGHALAALGDLAAEDGEALEAVRFYTASLELRERIGDRLGQGWMHHSLATARSGLGELDEATRHAEAARRIAVECGDPDLSAACEPVSPGAQLS